MIAFGQTLLALKIYSTHYVFARMQLISKHIPIVAVFQNWLVVLKIYNACDINSRFSVLVVNFGTQPLSHTLPVLKMGASRLSSLQWTTAPHSSRCLEAFHFKALDIY